MRQFLLKFALLSVSMIFLATLAFAQVKPFPLTFTTTLTGANVVSPVETTGSGTVVAVLVGNELTVTGMYQDLSSPIRESGLFGGASISVAPIGEEALVEALTTEQGVLDNPPSMRLTTTGGTSGTFSGVFTLSGEQVQALEDDFFYVQLYTLRKPDGELRGQILTDVVLTITPEDMVGIWEAEGRGGITHHYYADGTLRFLVPWVEDQDEVSEVPDFRWELNNGQIFWLNDPIKACDGPHVHHPVLFDDGRLRLLVLQQPCPDRVEVGDWVEFLKVDEEGNRVMMLR